MLVSTSSGITRFAGISVDIFMRGIFVVIVLLAPSVISWLQIGLLVRRYSRHASPGLVRSERQAADTTS
jgi:hypothetical protein